MKRGGFLAMTAAGLVSLAAAGFAGGAEAQPAKSANDAFVGSWSLVAVYYTSPNAPRSDSFGPNPRGHLRLESDGTFTLQIMAAGLPKFASKSRTDGTAEENKAIVQGTISYYGTYSFNDADKIFSVHIVASSYPNFDGVDQKRPYTVDGEELTFINAVSSVAGSVVHQTWKRIK